MLIVLGKDSKTNHGDIQFRSRGGISEKEGGSSRQQQHDYQYQSYGDQANEMYHGVVNGGISQANYVTSLSF